MARPETTPPFLHFTTGFYPGEDEALIDGALYEVYRGYETGSRGNYGVKCRAK